MSASMILNVGYAIDVQSADDPLVVMIEKAMETVALAGSPGSFVVDSLPIRKFWDPPVPEVLLRSSICSQASP